MTWKSRWKNRQSCSHRRWSVYCLIGGSLMCFLVPSLLPVTRKVSHKKTTFMSLTSSQENLPTVRSLLVDMAQSNSSRSDLSTPKNITKKKIKLGNITNKNTNLSELSTASVPMTQNVTLRENRPITTRDSMTQKVKSSANMTRNMQTLNIVSHLHGDVMLDQKPPSDIVPLKSANYSVCVHLMGGLGNQMFQFATTYGLAAKKRMAVAIGKTDHLTKIFKLNIDKWENYRNICKTFVGRGEKLNCGYDETMASFPSNNNYRVSAYLQSWMYFYNASTSLRKQFVFQDYITETKNKVIDSVLKKYNFISRTNVTMIGVHIRRGDLVNHTFGYTVASKSYLQKSVNYFQSKRLENVIFIICSNDMKWSKENMPKGIRSEYIEGNSPGVDMAILGSCDHMISTVGSFGWWSAWLTGGVVTFYQWPAKEGSLLRKQFSKDYVDYFHPGWIGFS